MKACDEYSETAQLYFDKELRGTPVAEFRAHLKGCAACRCALEEDEELSFILRQSRPLYSAPDSLQARVLRAIRDSSSEQQTHVQSSDIRSERIPADKPTEK
jgi:hypothetical protein